MGDGRYGAACRRVVPPRPIILRGSLRSRLRMTGRMNSNGGAWLHWPLTIASAAIIGRNRMPAGYKLATYASAKGPRAGIIVGETLYDAAGLTGQASDATVLGILEDWDAAAGRCKAAAAKAKDGKAESMALAQAKLLAPVRWPSAIYCAGANFTDHMLEMAKVQNIAPEP